MKARRLLGIVCGLQFCLDLFMPCAAFIDTRSSIRYNSKLATSIHQTYELKAHNDVQPRDSKKEDFTIDARPFHSLLRTAMSCVAFSLLLLQPQPQLNIDLHTSTNTNTNPHHTAATTVLPTISISHRPPPAAMAYKFDSSAIPNKGFAMKNGVKYYEVKSGDGPQPAWGDLVTYSYTMYAKLQPADDPVVVDDDKMYMVKHGNGRTIEGLEEGVHTMQVGGKRRIIVPSLLAYNQPGLGPIPENPFLREKLKDLLGQFTDNSQLIFDVELVRVTVDEADVGYYTDRVITDEDIVGVMRKRMGTTAGTTATGEAIAPPALDAIGSLIQDQSDENGAGGGVGGEAFSLAQREEVFLDGEKFMPLEQ